MSTFKSPYPQFGGKSRIAAEVWRRFGDVPAYTEPFFGSGAVLLGRPGWTPEAGWVETVNDKDGMICNFWRALQAAPDEVARFADWPANENDLHARHIWLVNQKFGTDFTSRLEGDPDYYDAKVAGWWVWGMALWIGSGFCSGSGKWQSVDGKLTDMSGAAGRGVQRQLVHLGDAGRGDPGTGEAGLNAWMQALSDRMRRVRVCSGDWKRACTPAALYLPNVDLVGVFLDPPYSAEAGRAEVYSIDDFAVAHEVRAWCLEHGDAPHYRIALCGYDIEHTELETAGWSVFRWKTQGGMSSLGNGRGKDNATREVVWFSPFCLKPGGNGAHNQMEMFETMEGRDT